MNWWYIYRHCARCSNEDITSHRGKDEVEGYSLNWEVRHMHTWCKYCASLELARVKAYPDGCLAVDS